MGRELFIVHSYFIPTINGQPRELVEVIPGICAQKAAAIRNASDGGADFEELLDSLFR